MTRRIDEEIERQAIELYKVQKLSIPKVAKKLRISNDSVRRILIRNNVPRRSKSEACMKYAKIDFDGDPAELARLSGFIDDCGAGYARKLIHVQTSTTHSAQTTLFDGLFSRYGHVSRTPGYNERFSVYQWHLQVLLNRSFDFLIEYKRNPVKFIAASRDFHTYDYIGGLADAESWVGIAANGGHPLATLQIVNNNRQILEYTQTELGGNFVPSKAGYNLRLYGEQAVEALRKLTLTHWEKATARQLVLHHADNGGIGMEALRAYRELRRKIDEEVKMCTLQARIEYIRRHGRPHPKDPDRKIPPN